MKGFVAIILFFVLVLLGTKAGHLSSYTEVDGAEICAVNNDCDIQKCSMDAGAIIPLTKEGSLADMEFSDAHTLAHRVSASAERMYRFSSIETSHFVKGLLRRMATRMANLANCSTLEFDTSRSLNWGNACEHYIFGMRRILI